MAVEISYPGVYVEETSSGIHPIEGVSTSITAFVGWARGGPVNDPVCVHGLVEFEHAFGGPSPHSTLDVAVRLFFENGGREALIVRVGAKNGRPITDADNANAQRRLDEGERHQLSRGCCDSAARRWLSRASASCITSSSTRRSLESSSASCTSRAASA